MRCVLAQIVAFALLAAAATSAGARTVSSGVITVGHGANGVELGMQRAQVIQKLGKPNMENGFGTMSYGSDRSNTIFDIYRTHAGANGTVRQFVIASPRNRAFRLQDGNRIFTKGGLRRVANAYRSRLRFHRFDDGTPYYELISRLHGRKVLTDFETDRHSLGAYVLDVFIVYA
jgi:hypothetical protein